MDQFKFTTEFEELIISTMINYPESLINYVSIIDPKYFTGSATTTAAKAVLDYAMEFGKFPGWGTAAQLIVDSMRRSAIDNEEEKIKEASDMVARLKANRENDSEFVSSQIVKFCRERAVIMAIKKSIEFVKEGKTPDANFTKWFEDALQVGQNIDDIGYILHDDYEKVIDKITKVDYGVKTGFPMLDRVWKRGLAPGWLIILLAPPKRYKTTLCLNMALNMVGPGIQEDVIYYACEISQELAVARALYNLAGQPEDFMHESTGKFREIVAANIKEKIAGNFLFKGFPSKSATIADIKMHAKMAIKQLGIKPKAIFIDYAETVKPSSNGGKDQKDYRQQSDIYTEARAMGHELGCAIIMPDRCNKETVAMEVPSMTSFQGSFEKAGIVDGAIGLCGTDDEISQNMMRFFIFLNRHGAPFGHFRGRIDPEIMKITINEEIEYDPQKEEKKEFERGRKSSRKIPDELQ
jgi:KaiC/GvpD/RAD55 family RecA-like ATPase